MLIVNEGTSILEVLSNMGAIHSFSEGRRMLHLGAVRLDGNIVIDFLIKITDRDNGSILACGKKSEKLMVIKD